MNPQVKLWLEDRKSLENSYQYYLDRDIIQKIPESENLVNAHIEKADHNNNYINLS